MFLLRSAFWLTAAYMVIAPTQSDLGDRAQAAGADIVRGGQSLITAGISNAPACESFECTAGRAIVMSAVNQAIPSPVAPQASQPIAEPALVVALEQTTGAPIPPRRPDWAG